MTRDELLAMAKKAAHDAVDERAAISEERFLSASAAAASTPDMDWNGEARELALGFLEEAAADLQDLVDEDELDDEDLDDDDDLPDDEDDEEEG
jgi:hypothetical protein